MESSSTVSRYVLQNSKKRVFPSGSSSSGCKEVEVLEIPPPINRTPKSKSSKQKEKGICHGIIDIDMEEDDGDVMLIDGDVMTSSKGKSTSSSFPVGLSSITNGASGINAQTPVNVDDDNPNLFYGEDEWIDTYYDELVFDDYDTMGSHFDHMDIPPGVEAPFPWLPGTAENYTETPTTSSSTKPSSHFQSAAVGPSPGLVSLNSRPSKIGQTKTMSTSWDDPSRGQTANVHHVKGKWPSKWSGAGLNQKESTTSSSKAFLSSQLFGVSSAHKPAVEQLYSSLKSKRRSRTSHALSSSYNQYHSGSNFSSIVNNGSSYPTPDLPNHAQGLVSYMPTWEDLPMNMFQPSMGSPGFMSQNVFDSNLKGPNNQNSASPIGSAPPRVDPKNVDEILQKFDVFKKFDTVEDYSDHHYSKNGSSAKQPPKNWAKRIQDEWKILEKDLPDKVFVRVYESRMDLLRAVIVGAEGTPYHDGLYFFDVYFPSNYPSVPPHVHYHSGGLRINPNLYNCGKVCLSLLNTWSGSSKEKWLPGTSTMLQVLVSIQGLILNAKPYFNEPGYASTAGSMNGEKMSLDYNERTFMYSLQTMLYNIRRPPKYFEDFVVGHFCKHGRDILVYCKAYLDGAQVGCLTKGGVQDVDEGDKSCSQQFKNNLAGFITSIVNEFMQIGVEDCQEFLSLSQKATGPPTAAPRNYFY